jgi:iodothyronine deiodinase-like protein
LGALHDLYEAYRQRVAFFIVYIKEAHPEDGWVVIPNRDEGIRLLDPTTDGERGMVADACVLHSAIRVPVLVDHAHNAVASAYGGWPDRLYLIGRDGRVAFQGDMGPEGFQPALLAAAIRTALDEAG